jgi:pectate lyase
MNKIVFLWVVILHFASVGYAADGFGQNTTGGAGGQTVTVTNGADFLTYVQTVNTPYIIQVSGTIELADADNGRVRIQSNKTIRGIGENPTIIGSLGFKNDCSNVIIERLTITCPKDYTSEEDAISVKERITNVFITKCTIFDSWDSCVDIARQSDWVTVSWCKFYFTAPNDNNDRVSLVGNTDSSGDEGTLHVTFHHNWFGQYCMQRMPSLRYGRGHIYNNYYYCPGNIYCIWSRIQAEALIENNYFKEVKDPYVNNRDGEPVARWGKIAASGNILDNCTGTVHPGTDTVFTPPYAYTLTDTALVPVLVQWGAGADGKDGFPPHWMFGMYGDFDLNGFVDISDFSTLAGYWLKTEGIEDADYFPDGIIDVDELALFVTNWLYIPPDTTPPAAPANLSAAAGSEVVILNWDDNTESDLAGYNVYRSETPGTGYSKLNASLLEDSAYTDNTVTNNAVYFYVIRAVDTSSNESGPSAVVSAVPVDENTLIIQENETGFCGLDGIVDTGEHPGYTGYGYCDTTNATGKGINWRIQITSADTYIFTWRFANGSSARPARLLVNSVEEVSSINFPATGAWENWTTVSVPVTLTAGTKDIRLESTTSGGCANIDYFMVGGAAPEVAVCQ